MSKYDAEVYEKFSSQVRKQVQALRLIISGLQAKAKDRQWLKNQTMGNCFVIELKACLLRYNGPFLHDVTQK